MRQIYLKPKKQFFSFATACVAVIVTLATPVFTKAQGLTFTNASLTTAPNTAGKDGAVYRFPNVTTNVDAYVKINGRSSSDVKLSSIDISNTGWDKAFQPEVTYKNRSAWSSSERDWWMEFEISFQSTITNAAVAIDNMDVTAIDIDGDSYSVNEWVSFYNLKSYVTEQRTLLNVADVLETVLNVLKLTGKKFSGPITTYDKIDTSATRVMATTKYANTNKFRVRTGGRSSSYDIDAERMYSFWFKSFAYQAPQEGSLPVVLSAFNVKKSGSQAVLSWTTDMEANVSHFLIEKSGNGKDFTEAGILFTDGNSTSRREYSFKDELKNTNAALVYYRLKIVDKDGQYQQSAVKLIKLNEDGKAGSITVFPNPVASELRITLASTWQEQQVSMQVIDANGKVVMQTVAAKPGQTETIDVSRLTPGMYVLRVTNGTEAAVQRFVKTK